MRHSNVPLRSRITSFRGGSKELGGRFARARYSGEGSPGLNSSGEDLGRFLPIVVLAEVACQRLPEGGDGVLDLNLDAELLCCDKATGIVC